MCVYDYSNVTSTVCYLTLLFLLFCACGKEKAGISDGRLDAGASVEYYV